MAFAAAAVTIEIGFTGARVTGQHVLDGEDGRSAQRVVEALAQEVGQVFHLRVGVG
jgi:hypothetical protein